MAEGATAPAVNGSKAEDATRGRPYYDKLRKDLKDTLEKKRELDRNMQNLEATIARAETAYLEETSAAGNIIKGFDNYIKASTAAGGAAGSGTATRRKGGITEADKIFSKSSVSWHHMDSSAPLSLSIHNASGTSSEAPTPSGVSGRNTPLGSAKAGSKNKKKAAIEKDRDDEGDERPTKRGKVSWVGRD